jgi:hypothetical protein
MQTLFSKQAPELFTKPNDTPPMTSMTPFTAFAVNPKGLRFETQEKDETVILFLRQHIITLAPWILLGGLLILLPSVGLPIFLKLFHASIHIPVGYIIVGTIFWYIASAGFIFSKFLYWFFNIFIVTDQRIVDIDFYNLLYKDVAEAKITRIQDMSYQARGIFAALFNYGDVTIETAGEQPNFSFESVPKPSEIVDIISDLTKKKVQPV